MASENLIELGGWRFVRAPDAGRISRQTCDRLAGLSVAAAAGRSGPPSRRSRHATTYHVRVGADADANALEAFVKVYDRPRGANLLKRLLRGSRAERAAAAAAALRERGFGVARVIFCGEEISRGRAMLVTERAPGAPLAAILDQPAEFGRDRSAIEDKRRLLRALGAEVGRLHRAGYVHGDLTPYNIFFAPSMPPRFVFIDHDRTRSAFPIGRRRRQLRNLVQLLRFNLRRLTRTDRVRIVRAWAAELGLHDRNSVMHRAFRMLKLRLARDAAKAGSRPEAAGSPEGGTIADDAGLARHRVRSAR